MVAQLRYRAFRRAAGMAALILPISLGLALTGCKLTGAKKLAAVPKSCPDGAELKGAPPPDGTEIWCEKDVGGVPVKDGVFVVYNLNGSRMIEGYYDNGKQTGEWTMWYSNGQRSSVDHYTDGLQNGLHTSWYANGAKAIEGEYRDGKRDGVWHRWDPNGFKEWTDVYKDDVKVSGGVSDGPKAKIP
jgi:MORN repeat variant